MATRTNQNLATPSERPANEYLPNTSIIRRDNAFGQCLEVLAPGASGAELVTLFGGRAKRTAILNWRSGLRSPPQWARDLIGRYFDEIGELCRQAIADPPAKPRQDRGRYLRQWHARRAAQKQTAATQDGR